MTNHERLSLPDYMNCLSLATQTGKGAAYAVVQVESEKSKLTLLWINFGITEYDAKSGYPIPGTDLQSTKGFFINSSSGPDFYASAVFTQSGFTYDTGLVFTSLDSRRKISLFEEVNQNASSTQFESPCGSGDDGKLRRLKKGGGSKSKSKDDEPAAVDVVLEPCVAVEDSVPTTTLKH